MGSIYNLTEDDYRDLINKSSKFYNNLKTNNSSYISNMYEVYLSNGDKIKIMFDEANLPHLLGFKNLEKLDNGSRGVDVFKKMMTDNSYKELVIKKIINNGWDFSKYISHKYYLKTQYINNAIKAPFPKEVYFVCKYNMMANAGCSDSLGYSDCEYYIGKKESNGDISLVGFVKNGKYSNTYAPRTNRVFLSMTADQELKDLLTNQIICYVSAVKIHNNSEKSPLVFLNNTDKMDVLQDLITLANKSNAIVDCAKDYLFSVKKAETERICNSDVKEIIENIAVSTSKGEIIEKDDEELEKYDSFKDVIKYLIDSINDRLCSNKKNDSATVSYSKLSSDFKKLSTKILSFQSKCDKLEEEKKELLKINKTIKDESEDWRRKAEKAEKKVAKLELKLNPEEKKDE